MCTCVRYIVTEGLGAKCMAATAFNIYKIIIKLYIFRTTLSIIMEILVINSVMGSCGIQFILYVQIIKIAACTLHLIQGQLWLSPLDPAKDT